MKTTKKILGFVSVDSGQVIIVDPCYLGDWKDGEYNPSKELNNHYAKACKTTLNKKQGGQIIVSGIQGTGVASSTGYGDGNYPVEATYKNGRVQKLTIKFI